MMAGEEKAPGRNQMDLPVQHRYYVEVRNRTDGLNFLVDTGAQSSIVQATPEERKRPPTRPMRAANNSPILTWGFRDVQVDLGLGKVHNWQFVVADVNGNLLGFDFLRTFDLLVDCGKACLTTYDKMLSDVGCIRSLTYDPALHWDAPTGPEYDRLLQGYPQLLTRPNEPLPPVIHDIQHFIKTTAGNPVTSRCRRLGLEQTIATQEELNRLEAMGVVRKSHSS